MTNDLRPILTVQCVTKKLAGREVLHDVNLTCNKGEVVGILGPSGAGKTTLLRIVSGLVPCDEGTVVLNGQTVSGDGVEVPPADRGVGVCFQTPALWPHMTVLENVAFALPQSQRTNASEMARTVLEEVGIQAHLYDRPAANVSGGEARRVSLARALVKDPPILLLDEPWNDLDGEQRDALISLVLERSRERGITVVFTTHLRELCLGVADRIAVMGEGTILRQGNPEDCYKKPRSRLVARALGPVSFIVGDADGTGTIQTTLGELPVGNGAQGPVWLGIRPEGFSITENGTVEGVIREVRFRAGGARYRIEAGETAFWVNGSAGRRVGESVFLVPDRTGFVCVPRQDEDGS